MGKNFIQQIGVFLLTFTTGLLLLMLVNCIPQEAIQENTETSTLYLEEGGGFPVLIKGWGNTRMDSYADAMLLDVIYHVDSDNPLYSAIADSYYRVDGEDGIGNLKTSVFDGEKPQNEYSRYWHGMQLFVRPMLTAFSIEEIRYILGGILLALNLWLFVLLWKRDYKTIAVLYGVSLVAVDAWMCAFSIEYVSVFMLMTMLCIGIVLGKGKRMDLLFTVGGALTCFFDFLTTETLTFLIPVILWLLMRYRDQESFGWKQEWKCMIYQGFNWIRAYAGMFLIKWILVYFVCGADSFELALSSATVRINGSVTEAGAADVTGLALQKVLLCRNLGCLFHLKGAVTAQAVLIAGVVVVLAVLAYFYLFHRKEYSKPLAGTMLLIGFVPYIRYMIIANHSCMHYFFTYRAQMATVFACLGALYISTNMLHYMKKTKGANRSFGKSAGKRKGAGKNNSDRESNVVQIWITRIQ